jgi:hypothetical protein
MADRSRLRLQALGSEQSTLLRCTRCGARIELCAFCESVDCSLAICYRCLRQELRQSLAQPHPHGG